MTSLENSGPMTIVYIADLKALRSKAEAYDEAHRYALNLVTAMAKDFPAVPEWQPLEDLTGMVMQIDNMSAGRSTKAEAGKWATAHGFKPGDVFVGKAVQVKIHSMLFGEDGLLSIYSVAASVKGTHAGIWSKETRAFTLEQWRKFIGAHTKEPQ